MSGNMGMSRRAFVAGSAVALGTAALAGSAAGSALAAEGAYTAGTYTATANGIGTITATVTVDASNITAIDIDTSGETSFVGGPLGAVLAEQMLDAQGTEVDAIAGSTYTYKGCVKAVNDCLAQARGEEVTEIPSYDTATDEDWLGTEPEIKDDLIANTVDTDILIVGAGNAGMAAAAYAAQNGLNFRIVEKAEVPQDMRGWYGAIDSSKAIEQGCEPVNRHKLLSEISRYASGKCDQRVVRMWIEESAAMHDFVSGILEADPYDYTCTVTSGDAAHWPDQCSEDNTTYFFPEQEVFYGFNDISRQAAFQAVVEGAGYTIDFKQELVKLVKDGDRVAGAITQNTEDGTLTQYNVTAGVLLACGGYDGNPRMMQALDPLSCQVITCSNASPRDRGVGIRAGLWAGACLQAEPATMIFDRGLVLPGVDSGYVDNPAAFCGKEWPGTLKQYNGGTQPFLKVNRHGERFMNESQLYDNANFASFNQPGHVYCQICDANANTDADTFHTIGCSAGAQNGGMLKGAEKQVEAGLVQKADTLDELADMLGFVDADKDTFLATVDRYNELFEKGDDEDFGKAAIRLSAIKEPPFYGAWLGGSLLCTMQGLLINENAQCVDADREPIEGLYAAGNNSGSFFANNYPCILPGTRCGSAMTQGIKAIKQMGGLE